MSLKYHVVKRKVLSGEHEGEERVYGQIRAGNKISFDKLCDKIALLSTATKGDIQLVVNGLLTVMVEYLESGDIVQLGDLGNFQMTAGSRGAETMDEFNASYMKKGRIKFRPGKLLTRLTNEVSFEKMSVKVVQEICDRVHAA